MAFINLKTRSCYSLLESTITIDALICYAQDRQLKTVSLVEDGSMHSAVKFYRLTKAAGIKPIFGISLNVSVGEASSKWTLFARNTTGYRVLLKLTSDAGLDGVVLSSQVAEYAEDLIVCVDLITAATAKAFDLPHLYVGLSSQEDVPHAKGLTHLGLPFVFLNDVRTLDVADVSLYKVLLAIKENTTVSQVNLSGDLHFLTTREAKQLSESDDFLRVAMENTVKIANDCNVDLELGKNLLPKFEVPKDRAAIDYLRALCLKGATRRYGDDLTDLHMQRLEYELSVIERMGYADYFLIVWDFVKYAKQNQILVGPGRGSAAGSLISYVLGITGVDPIKFDLLFERFLNPERISLPDMDIDFQDDRRDEVIDYVQKKYGEYAVCQIATFGTFGTRSSWRDTARVHGLQTAQINAVSKFLTSRATLEGNLRENKSLAAHLESHPTIKQVYVNAMKVEGMPRHVSTHAAGVIISPKDLRNFTALTKGGTDVYLSQYEAEDLENIGLLKMDFLGLRNLTMIQEISNQIKESMDLTFDINQVPFDDAKTYELIASAHTTGVFQLESAGMRTALRQIKPTNLEDIISALALFRPGPMANIPMFAARKNGQQAISYDHPSLEGILKNTYGIIVYQEQIMQIASLVAGYSLGESDILRRAISKKDSGVMRAEGQQFIARAVRRGYTLEVSTKIFELILKFANYGFNRSHAASYAFVSYQMAYLKANYPQFFFVSSLRTAMNDTKQVAEVIKEARSFGITVVAPNINHSIDVALVKGDQISLGFLSIKHVGKEVAGKLLAERSKGCFTTFYDFIKRTQPILNEKTIAALIDVGTLEEFGDKETLHMNLPRALDYLTYDGGLLQTEFIMNQAEGINKGLVDEMEREFELLGFYLNAHPINLYQEVIKGKGWLTPSNLPEQSRGRVLCAGFVNRVREIRDKNGNLMAFMEIGDETTGIDVTIFSKSYNPSYKELTSKVIVIEGNLDVRNGKMGINLNKILTVLGP